MSPVRIPHDTYVLVCDGSKALLLRNAGNAIDLDLKLVEVTFEPHPPTRELGADRPGRVHESLGASRSSVRAPDWHEVAEADFIRSVAHRLDETVRSQGVKDLVIVAPPRTLGELRSFLSSSVRTIITSEVDKELARLTTAEIERHLAALSKLP